MNLTDDMAKYEERTEATLKRLHRNYEDLEAETKLDVNKRKLQGPFVALALSFGCVAPCSHPREVPAKLQLGRQEVPRTD